MTVYYGPEPLEVNGYRIGLEYITYMGQEIVVLLNQHYAETEVAYLDEPVKVDLKRYAAFEQGGTFWSFTTRRVDTDQMVGYLIGYLQRSMHAETTIATEDAFYLVKDCRGSGLAKKMLQYAEKALKARGADYLFMTSKKPVGGPNIGPFLETQGYRPVAVAFSKKLEV